MILGFRYWYQRLHFALFQPFSVQSVLTRTTHTWDELPFLAPSLILSSSITNSDVFTLV